MILLMLGRISLLYIGTYLLLQCAEGQITSAKNEAWGIHVKMLEDRLGEGGEK